MDRAGENPDSMADLSSGMTAQAPLLLMQPPVPRLRDGVVGRNQEALAWLSCWMQAAGGKAESYAETKAGAVEKLESQPDTPAAMERQLATGLSLMLWGASGAGKTFWLQAWAGQPPCHVVFDLRQPAETESLIAAIAEQQHKRLWIIDNIDAASVAAQQALFTLFIRLQQDRLGRKGPEDVTASELSQVIATANAAPAQLKEQLRDDLRTRLGQGLVFELHELSDTEKVQALRERAFRLGWMASPIVVDYDHLFAYMLARLPRQLGKLMHLLDALDARALSLKRAVTLPLMRSLLDENLSLF